MMMRWSAGADHSMCVVLKNKNKSYKKVWVFYES